MSSGLQHKMLNYEIPPPTGIWEKISLQLDDAAMSHQFPALLKNAAITPPSFIWSAINNELDEESIEKLYAKKMALAEAIPPASIWDSIQTLLDEQNAPAKSSPAKISPFLRYAAAAILIGLLAWWGIRFLTSNSNSDELATSQPTTPSVIESPVTPVLVTPSDPPAPTIAKNDLMEDEMRNNKALEASKKTYAKANTAETKLTVAKNYYFSSPSNTVTSRGLDDYDYFSYNRPISSGNRYVTLMTPEGNIIRVSRKLGDLVYCVSGQDQDQDCVEQVKKWQEKIANSTIAQSPDNFMDLFNLVNSLQNNNDL